MLQVSEESHRRLSVQQQRSSHFRASKESKELVTSEVRNVHPVHLMAGKESEIKRGRECNGGHPKQLDPLQVTPSRWPQLSCMLILIIIIINNSTIFFQLQGHYTGGEAKQTQKLKGVCVYVCVYVTHIQFVTVGEGGRVLK